MRISLPFVRRWRGRRWLHAGAIASLNSGVRDAGSGWLAGERGVAPDPSQRAAGGGRPQLAGAGSVDGNEIPGGIQRSSSGLSWYSPRTGTHDVPPQSRPRGRPAREHRSVDGRRLQRRYPANGNAVLLYRSQDVCHREGTVRRHPRAKAVRAPGGEGRNGKKGHAASHHRSALRVGGGGFSASGFRQCRLRGGASAGRCLEQSARQPVRAGSRE